jgi:hypothetical protein
MAPAGGRVAEDPVVGPVAAVKVFEDQDPLAGVAGEDRRCHGRIRPCGEPEAVTSRRKPPSAPGFVGVQVLVRTRVRANVQSRLVGMYGA